MYLMAPSKMAHQKIAGTTDILQECILHYSTCSHDILLYSTGVYALVTGILKVTVCSLYICSHIDLQAIQEEYS